MYTLSNMKPEFLRHQDISEEENIDRMKMMMN